ncbi:aspartyl-phosphate phosphatase Spo0E family protein [Bacillus methanolicus]|uniref:aspartyl-phosphate phosphatase Spo0E family protein n=1 Tax=Bacillus methanolicus TaxID=1471 RepID=UPI002380749F|nr:aspartyl-phosphate phosphatase Spo0E family protein [Bacillus methanolicus]MDE3838315.1 aspartyl-phosphate phosphatase Spo0E family protein [Bacillus methanolicus]
MCTNKQRMMKEIQHKREKMIDSAQKHGLTSERTIRCSQELDMLLNEYQRTFQSRSNGNKVNTTRKQIFVAMPKAVANA